MEKWEYQQKIDGKWSTTYEDTNPATVHKSLSRELIAKKLEQCTYIRSIKRIQNYNGTLTIVVTYSNGDRSLYTISDH